MKNMFNSPLWGRTRGKRNTQQELVMYLLESPGATEREICEDHWSSSREKKHADLIRRALRSGMIRREKSPVKQGGRHLWIYNANF
jgi:predicted transcriptional regulator